MSDDISELRELLGAAKARLDDAVARRDRVAARSALDEMRRVVADFEADLMGDAARWTWVDDAHAGSEWRWVTDE